MIKLNKNLGKIKIKVRYWISSILINISGKRISSKKLLLQYKNKFQGKRCFIIGNGPSLTPEDLDELKNEFTFSSNRIFNIFNNTQWRPTFYAIFDDGIANSEEVRKKCNSFDCEIKFLRQQGYLDNRHVTGNVCYINSWNSRKYLTNPEFSIELTRGIYTIATVTYALIQIARYMGFSEIYLLGMDHRFANSIQKDGSILKDNSIKSHFDEKKGNKGNIEGATWEMDVAYHKAEEFSKKNNFRIYNVTRGGALEIFERKNFDDVIKM